MKPFATILLSLFIISFAFDVKSQVKPTGQGESKSAYKIIKEKPVKQPIPDYGMFTGRIREIKKKTAVPLVFVDIEGGQNKQADKNGIFEIELQKGTYNIKVYSAGYKDLLIKDLVIQEGMELNIEVRLENASAFKKK